MCSGTGWFHRAPISARDVTLAVLLLIAAGPRTLFAQQPWTSQTPAPRWGHAIVYDSARSRPVMFGGVYGRGSASNSGYLAVSETWEKDESGWRFITSIGPPPRRCPAMAYDAARQQVVMHGGEPNTPYEWDDRTWVWGGLRWSVAAATGPAFQAGPAMTFDSQRNVAVLVGGWDPMETWEWDGAAWAQRAVGGPPPRQNAALCYDPLRGVTVLFGGWFDGSRWDTWEWDGQTWTQRMPPYPAPDYSYGSCMVFDASRGKIVLLTPEDYSSRRTWTYDGVRYQALSYSEYAPFTTFGAMYYDPLANVIEFFGGSLNGATDPTWWSPFYHLIGNQWSRLPGYTSMGPSWQPRAMTYHRTTQRVVYFCRPSGDPVRPETWEFDGQRWTSRTNIGPRVRSRHAMTYDSWRNVSVMFGGCCDASGGRFSNTWEWDGNAWLLRAPNGSGPPAREHTSLAFDEWRGRSVLFGGWGLSASDGDDTWEWNGDVWKQMSPTGPSSRWGHAMVFDAQRGVTVLFGGRGISSSEPLGDTWEWDGANWTLRSLEGPAPRAFHNMAYDRQRGKTVLYGGIHHARHVATREVWEWDGNRWRIACELGPEPRDDFEMTYDEDRHRCIIRGGIAYNSNIALQDTWEYLGPVCSPGDMNQDAVVDAADVPLFVSTMLDPSGAYLVHECAADVDGSGAVDGDDIAPFIALLNF